MTAQIKGPAGGVAAALATGLRGEIPDRVRQQMRDSGLAHLLAISGLHIGLVTAFVFALVRGGLALGPGFALRWPLKKIAAVVALLAAAIYMMLAGATVPTQRAFIMTAIILVAMLLNRTGISLRLISLAASLATAPFAVFHFHRLALLGLVANLAAVPIAALWVMPLEVLVLVLMPFGLEGTVTPLLGGGVEAILWIAATVSAWPFAAITLPAPGPVAMLMMVAGGLWLALWQRRWRLAGVVAITLGLTGAGPLSQPDILIAEEARLVGLRSGGDVLHLSNPQAQPFVRDVWQRRTGADLTQAFPPPGQENGTLRCDG